MGSRKSKSLLRFIRAPLKILKRRFNERYRPKVLRHYSPPRSTLAGQSSSYRGLESPSLVNRRLSYGNDDEDLSEMSQGPLEWTQVDLDYTDRSYPSDIFDPYESPTRPTDSIIVPVGRGRRRKEYHSPLQTSFGGSRMARTMSPSLLNRRLYYGDDTGLDDDLSPISFTSPKRLNRRLSYGDDDDTGLDDDLSQLYQNPRTWTQDVILDTSDHSYPEDIFDEYQSPTRPTTSIIEQIGRDRRRKEYHSPLQTSFGGSRMSRTMSPSLFNSRFEYDYPDDDDTMLEGVLSRVPQGPLSPTRLNRRVGRDMIYADDSLYNRFYNLPQSTPYAYYMQYDDIGSPSGHDVSRYSAIGSPRKRVSFLE